MDLLGIHEKDVNPTANMAHVPQSFPVTIDIQWEFSLTTRELVVVDGEGTVGLGTHHGNMAIALVMVFRIILLLF